VKRWSAVINYSRASGKPPQTADFDGYDALRAYLAPDSEVVAIAVYRAASDPAKAAPPATPSAAASHLVARATTGFPSDCFCRQSAARTSSVG
jgi:hypothetical protein